jgi:Spy/CpxP family protein refolding chaperone
MKRNMIWLSAILLIVLIGGGFAVVRSAGSDHRGCYGPRWGFHGPLGFLGRELNLTDAQKSQISTMWQTERPIVGALVKELASEDKEMESATAEGNLDQNTVQAIAGRQGETLSKLLVEKELFRSKVYGTVLTTDQRTKAAALEGRFHMRLYRLADRFATGGGK